MNKKVFYASIFVALATMGTIALQSVGTNFMLAKGVDNTPQTYIQLNHTNAPIISRGDATATVGETGKTADLFYSNVIESSAGHIKLLPGGYLEKVDSAKSLDSITVTFSATTDGRLLLYTGYDDIEDYFYELESGVAQSLDGNYFKLVARDGVIDISTLDLSYGCATDQTSNLIYGGTDFFDGNNWYTCTSTGRTETGTQLGNSVLDNGEIRIHRSASGSNNITGHIAVFKATDNLYVYNTNASGGIYKKITDYEDEFKSFLDVEHFYTFNTKCKHSFAFLVGGAVQAKLTPYNGTTGQGAFLATYIYFDYENDVVEMIQGATAAAYATVGKYKGDATFYEDGVTENVITIGLTRINDPTDLSAENDKLIIEVFVNGEHIDFTDRGTGSTGAYCKVDSDGNFVLEQRLYFTSQYGPYFGVYPTTPTDAVDDTEYDVRISSFKWFKEHETETKVYGVLISDTYIDSGSGKQSTNYCNSEHLMGRRLSGSSPGVYRDSYMKWNMADIWNDYSSRTNAEKSVAKLHILLHLTGTGGTGEPTAEYNPVEGDVGFYMLRCQTYPTQIDWDETTLTWSNRPSGMANGNFIKRNTWMSFEYSEDNLTLEVIVDFSTTEITNYVDTTTSENLTTIMIDGCVSDFALKYYSAEASDPLLRPTMYLTY